MGGGRSRHYDNQEGYEQEQGLGSMTNKKIEGREGGAEEEGWPWKRGD